MEVSGGQIVLILGCQRSGTSLLCSLLGAHSEVNMLYESLGADTFRLIGKKYKGNKVLAWRQIRYTQKASKFGHLINRIANLALTRKTFHKHRPYPIATVSIQDYLQKGAKIICIQRDKQEVVNSIVKRTPMNAKQASHEYDMSMKEMAKVADVALNINFHNLVTETESSLKEICTFLGINYETTMLKGVEYNSIYPNKAVVSEKSKQ